MRPVTGNALGLVEQVRNRLWLALIGRWTGLGLWLSAALLISLGLVQRLPYPLPLTVPVLAALLPPLAGLVAALVLRRPQWLDAARAADHQAEADSLLLSAWDLQRQGSTASGTAPLILLQAERQQSAWQARIDHYTPPCRGRFPTAASIACCLGAALLLLPPDGGSPGPAPTAGSRPLAARAENNPLTEIVRSVELATADSAPPGRQAQPPKAAADQGQAPAGPVTSPAAPPPAAARPAGEEPGGTLNRGFDGLQPAAARLAGKTRSDPADDAPPASGHGRNNAAGDQAGGGSSSDGGPPPTPPQLTSREVDQVAIKRSAGQGSGDYLSSQLSAADRTGRGAATERAAAPRQPAERPESMPLSDDLSPAQRNYVARYFQQLQSGSLR